MEDTTASQHVPAIIGWLPKVEPSASATVRNFNQPLLRRRYGVLHY